MHPPDAILHSTLLLVVMVSLLDASRILRPLFLCCFSIARFIRCKRIGNTCFPTLKLGYCIAVFDHDKERFTSFKVVVNQGGKPAWHEGNLISED
jgi:hypothetical protein